MCIHRSDVGALASCFEARSVLKVVVHAVHALVLDRGVHAGRLADLGLVEVVAVEDLLFAGATEQGLVLADLFGVIPLPFDVIVVEVFLFDVGDEGCFHFLRVESLPVEVIEPWMALHLFDAVDSQALGWLPHQALIDEVCGLFGVTGGQVFFLY